MIRKEGDRTKRSKNFNTTYVGNNRQMLQEIRDSLIHLRKNHSAETKSEPMQIKTELPGSQSPANLAGDTRTHAAKSSLYRQKALAEIRNSLLPFANENGLSSAASTVSTISSTTTSGISTASGLSNASGSSSPCQSVEHNGLDKDLSRTQTLAGLAYEEDSVSRAVKLNATRNIGEPTSSDTLYKLQGDPQHNGLQKQSSGPFLNISSKIIRKPSFESNIREKTLNLHRGSPALDSSTASTRSDSPSITLSGFQSRSTFDSVVRTNAQLPDSVSHLQVSRQYSPNFGIEPPPPPPPRTQGPPPTPPRGTTPPPAQLVQSTFLPTTQQVQHKLKRISPVPQSARTHATIGYNSPISQSSTPQRGTSPVSVGRSPMIVQNSLHLQQQLNQQIQSLYNGGVAQMEPPPPYPIGSTVVPGTVGIATKLTSPPPYTSTSSRQSPTQGNSDYPGVMVSQIQKRTSPTIYQNQLPFSCSSSQSPITPIVTTATVVNSSALRPAPLQAWSARQPPPIMLSVKSTQVQKPVLQTAVAPTAPPVNSPPPPPPPSYTCSIQQKVQVESQVNPSQVNSIGSYAGISAAATTPHVYVSAGSQFSTGANVVATVPTTEPPSYASTMQALAVQRGISPLSSNVVNTNLPAYSMSLHSATSASTTASQSSVTSSIESITNNLETQLKTGSPSPNSNTTVSVSNSQNTATATSVNVPKTSTVDQLSSGTPTHVSQPYKLSPVSPEANGVSVSSESPISHPSNQSPVSFVSSSSSHSNHSDSTQESNNRTNNNNNNNNATPPYKMTHQSPIPERKVQSKEKEEERRETKVRNYSPQAFKFYMEQHVENVLKSHQQRIHRRMQLETEMAKVGLSEEAQCQMRKMLHQKESNYIRLKRAKMDKAMFVKIKDIGVGAFGEVALVRKLDTNHLYAMKTLRKADVLKRNQVAHVKAERDILAEADNEWVVKLYYSFQDIDNLYFVMDYIPGGDLMSLLIKFGIFQEPLARFYIAELVCAVESVHKMGFIHRDIKPDNILIDRDGHIKLTDFGLCTGFRWTHNSKYYQKNGEHSRQDSMEPDENWTNECRCNNNSNLKPLERRRRREHQRCLAHSLVGTPNYIAPEVLMRTGYTQLCDWWSVGVILYEMLVGQPPFLASTPGETQYKVINWEKTLKIPKQANLCPESKDLILKLCTSHEKRLGKEGAGEVKSHPFFESIDFDGVRRQPPPYIPTIRYATDTSNFDPVDPDKLRNSDSSDTEDKGDSLYDNGKHPEHAFFEFTFRRFFDDGGHAYTTRLGSDDNDNQGPVYV